MKTISKAALLHQLEARIETHLGLVIASFQNRTDSELLQPAANGGWSITQCLEHLNSYGRYYLPAIEKGIQTSEDVMAPSFKSSWLGSYFTRLMEPGPNTKPMKSPKEHRPPMHLDAAKVMATFLEQQEWLLALVRQSAAKDINRIRITISISRWIRLNLGDVFGFIVAHDERHLKQAQRLCDIELKLNVVS